MKLGFTLFLRCASFFNIIIIGCTNVSGQTHTPIPVKINEVCGGYYEYLPVDYSGTSKHPLLIFLHGRGDLGNGSVSDLERLFQYQGLPLYIRQDKFPSFFTIKGKTFSFVVISPQFSFTPSAQDVNDVINYALNKYKDKIDPFRVYITGCSMGGGAVWNYARQSVSYASKIAAIVPVCGDSDPTTGPSVDPIPATNLPVWATHNSGDRIVQVIKTNNYITAINSYTPSPDPLAKKTIFQFESADLTEGHDAWTRTYDPTFKENGKNIYEWMLQYTRGSEVVLPAILNNYDVSVYNLNQAVLRWTTTSEQNNKYFTLKRSIDGNTFTELVRIPAGNSQSGSAYTYIDENPREGINYYRLEQTDYDGQESVLGVKNVTISGVSSNLFKIYPNPSSSLLEIFLNNQEKDAIKASIFSTEGRVISTTTFNKTQSQLKQQIDISSLQPGFYILEVKGKLTDYRKSFIKQ